MEMPNFILRSQIPHILSASGDYSHWGLFSRIQQLRSLATVVEGRRGTFGLCENGGVNGRFTVRALRFKNFCDVRFRLFGFG